MANQDPTSPQNTPGDSWNPQPPAEPKPPAGDAKPAVKKRRRRRRWPYVLLGLFLALMMLVVFAPAIASTGPVRNMVVGQINKNLKGHVEISDWSLSWTGGVSVTGVKVFDQDKKLVASVESLTTPLSLIGAIRGNLTLGDTVARGVTFDFTQYPDGTTTLDRLLKPSTESKPDSDLPNLSGRLRLENAHGTITQNTGDEKTSHLI
jgi:hypothetical protein